MKLFFLLTVLMVSQLHAEVLKKNSEGDFILTRNVFKVGELLADYGRLMNLNMTISSNLTNTPFEAQGQLFVPKEQIESYVSTILSMGGSAMIRTPGSQYLRVIDARDVRYASVPILKDPKSIPENGNQYQFSFELDHISSEEVSRNLRPFLSRYGRIIGMKDNSIHIADTGKNLNRIVQIIRTIDTPEYKKSKEEMGQINEKHKKALVQEKTFLEILNQNQIIFIFIFFLMGSIIGFGTRGYMMKKVEGGW